MEFTYRTATENITIDVSEELVAILQDWDRMERNNDHTETRRHYHLEACEYEGQDFAADDDAIERLLEMDAARRMVEPALEKLAPGQRQVIEAIFYKGMTVREYAASRGLSEFTVFATRRAAIKNLKKFLKP